MNVSTAHTKNMANDARIPNSKNTTAAAKSEKNSATTVSTRNTAHTKMLCQAWNRTNRLRRNAGKNKQQLLAGKLNMPP